MSRLIYSAITSLDGYIEDATGAFEWAAPDEEVFRYVCELERPIGTYLYGRRMYETMRYWETVDSGADLSSVEREFTDLWRAADKVVFSTTLASVGPRTRLERAFDAGAVKRWKETSDRDLSVGGPDLAAHAFRAGLVDECHLLVHPVSVGGGKPALPPGLVLRMELVDHRRFQGGLVSLRYRLDR